MYDLEAVRPDSYRLTTCCLSILHQKATRLAKSRCCFDRTSPDRNSRENEIPCRSCKIAVQQQHDESEIACERLHMSKGIDSLVTELLFHPTEPTKSNKRSGHADAGAYKHCDPNLRSSSKVIGLKRGVCRRAR